MGDVSVLATASSAGSGCWFVAVQSCSLFSLVSAGCCTSFPSTVAVHKLVSTSAADAVSTFVDAALAAPRSSLRLQLLVEPAAVAGAKAVMLHRRQSPMAVVQCLLNSSPAAVVERPVASFDLDATATAAAAVAAASVSPATALDQPLRGLAAARTIGQL